MQERMTGKEIEENTLVNRWVGEYLKERKKREQLEQKYELLVRTNKTHIDTLDQLNNKYIDLEKDIDRYLKALEEIEEIVYELCIDDAQEDCKHCDTWYAYKDILDTINKAKGEEDER